MKNIPLKYRFTAAVVVFLSLVAMAVRRILFPEIPWEAEVKIYFFSLFVFSIAVFVFFLINNTLNKIYPYEKNVAVRIILQIVIGLVFIFSARYLLVAFALKKAPIAYMVTKVFYVAIFLVDFFVCLAVNFAFFAEYFFSQWKKSIQRAERLEKEKTQVQYDNLKTKLNPHFLFNALTSLNTLIYDNQEQASQFLKQLSKVYRYLLQNNDLVYLNKELEFTENYVALLRTRFGKALEVKINIDDKDNDGRIVPVTLQSLIENALKHNVITEDKPLRIFIYSRQGFIVVENNLQRKSIVEGSNKQGLLNLSNLYQYLSEAKLLVEESNEKFKVSVPLIP